METEPFGQGLPNTFSDTHLSIRKSSKPDTPPYRAAGISFALHCHRPADSGGKIGRTLSDSPVPLSSFRLSFDDVPGMFRLFKGSEHGRHIVGTWSEHGRDILPVGEGKLVGKWERARNFPGPKQWEFGCAVAGSGVQSGSGVPKEPEHLQYQTTTHAQRNAAGSRQQAG